MVLQVPTVPLEVRVSQVALGQLVQLVLQEVVQLGRKEQQVQMEVLAQQVLLVYKEKQELSVHLK
jgi:hypothetical protein